MDQNWVLVAVVTGMWSLAIGLMTIGTANPSWAAVAWSLLVAMAALVPTLVLVFQCVQRWERGLWMDTIAASIAHAVLDEARSVSHIRR